MEHYESVYYGGQVEGRGLTSVQGLTRAFRRMAVDYSELLRGLLPQEKSVRCLDLGCGYGNWLYFLREQGFPNARGIDADPKQVALAQLLNLPAEVGDVRDAISSGDTYGLISAFDLIEHLDKNAAVKLIELCFEHLHVGGVLILRMPCADSFRGAHDENNDLTHRWSASSNMLRHLLRTIGFSHVVSVDPSAPRYPRTLRGHVKRTVRRTTQALLSIPAIAAGVGVPTVWAASQIAVATK